MTCCRCGKLGILAIKNREFGSRNHRSCSCCFYTLMGTSPAPGRVNRCVCVLGNVSRDACFLTDVFSPETLEGALSFTFPSNQVKSFQLIRFNDFRSESQSLKRPLRVSSPPADQIRFRTEHSRL